MYGLRIAGSRCSWGRSRAATVRLRRRCRRRRRRPRRRGCRWCPGPHRSWAVDHERHGGQRARRRSRLRAVRLQARPDDQASSGGSRRTRARPAELRRSRRILVRGLASKRTRRDFPIAGGPSAPPSCARGATLTEPADVRADPRLGAYPRRGSGLVASRARSTRTEFDSAPSRCSRRSRPPPAARRAAGIRSPFLTLARISRGLVPTQAVRNLDHRTSPVAAGWLDSKETHAGTPPHPRTGRARSSPRSPQSSASP